MTVIFARPGAWQYLTIDVVDGQEPPQWYAVDANVGTAKLWPGRYARRPVSTEHPPWIYTYSDVPPPSFVGLDHP